ncbi:MAG: ATP synthase F1 subunit delta [bacterium]|nr:ATP synthase F1 subunit delta [bacterium]
MTQIEMNYAIVLYELKVSEEVILNCKKIFEENPVLLKSLTSPVVDAKAKRRVIERIFPKEMTNFLKVLCDYQTIGSIEEIFRAYTAYSNEQKGIIKAILYCYKEPDEKEIQGFNRYIAKRYGKKKVTLKIEERADLLGGFLLRVKDYEIDWSLKGRLEQLKQILVRG